MSTQVLGGGLNDDVRAVLERPEIDWGGERRIDDERNAGILRQQRDGPQVEDAARRVDWRLEKDRSRLPAHLLPPRPCLQRVDEGDLDPDAGELLGEQLVGPAVDP